MNDQSNANRKSVRETVDPFEMKSFFDQITTLLTDVPGNRHRIDLPELLRAWPGECVYITDYKKKTLLYKAGFQALLGYPDEEVDFDFTFSGYHHEDEVMIKHIIKSAVQSAVKSFNTDPDLQLSMTYRRKRKDGSYIHLLSQSSIYELDANGNLLKSLTRLSDISYLNVTVPVSWSIRSSNLDPQEVNRSISASFKNPFTKREIEVIREIQKGGSNHQIAEKLFLSHHTVATHRKNIFRKCDCKTILELLVFCKRLDVL